MTRRYVAGVGFWIVTACGVAAGQERNQGRLEQIEHLQQREQEVRPGVPRRESVLLVRDVNGRFEPTERRIRETRTLGPSESVEEETIRRRDVNGAWTVTKRIVTHRFQGGAERQVFDRDVNGRFVLTIKDIEKATVE